MDSYVSVRKKQTRRERGATEKRMGIETISRCLFLPFLSFSRARSLTSISQKLSLFFLGGSLLQFLSLSDRSDLEEEAAFEREMKRISLLLCLDRALPLDLPVHFLPRNLFPSSTSFHLNRSSSSLPGRAPSRLAPAHLDCRRHLLRPEAPHSLASSRRGGDAPRCRRGRRRQALRPRHTPALLALGLLLRPAPAHRLCRGRHSEETELLRQHRHGFAFRRRRHRRLDPRVRARDLCLGAAARC